MKKILLILLIFTGGLAADDKIIGSIPSEFNVLSSVNFEEVFKKEMPFLRELAEDMDEDGILKKFEKAGFNLNTLKRLWFSQNVDANMNVNNKWDWLTFIEFTKDVKVEELLKIVKNEFKFEAVEGKIEGQKSFEVNNNFQDIFIIQPNPRLIILGSKESLKKSILLSKQNKEEQLQYSLLGNKQITDLHATVQEHQIWFTAYTKNKEKFLNLTDIVLALDFDKDLKFKSIMNFSDEMSCNQVYGFWQMLKAHLMQDQKFQMENKHFYDTKFDRSLLLKITFTKEVLKRAGMIGKKK